MKIHPVKTILILALLLLLLQACGGAPATETPTQTPPTALPPTGTLPPTAISHTVIPASLPIENLGIAADQDSSRTSNDQTAGGGDRFDKGEYERPFNAVTMDTYFPELDITQYEVMQDDTWIYASMILRSRSADGSLSGQYALEIDNDMDGRGDWLILVNAPAATEWSVENVQVWQDTNKDVGGNEAVNADKSPGFGDGYETKVFDSGMGSDADAAWARISPDNQNTVQIAVKAALVDDDQKYLAGVWAGRTLDPAMFDFNDKMTQEQAGAAVKSFAYYPIQALSELDRACRVSIGTAATGSDLGLCQVYAPQTNPSDPQPPPPSSGCQPVSCPSGWGFDQTICQCVLLPPP
ncbi:MAG: hypothetical protein HXY38_08650 [Chloroflexi bacterium]|nr:hypothetical protein [Chloroflexota bacterium]